MSWRRFFRRADRDAESARDIQFYLEMETENNLARGMPPEHARAAAQRKLGNSTSIREQIYRGNSIEFLETTLQDVRYALRTMRKSLVFTITATLTLAIGIGGNTAMFTVIRAVLLKPLEYPAPDRLVRLSLDNVQKNEHGNSFSVMRLEEMRASAKSFSGVGAFLKFSEDVSLSGRSGPEALKAARVSANFLDILGVKPIIGRSFLPEEDSPSGPAVAMISARLWKRRFEGDPQIAGKSTTLNSTPYTIIGVLPKGFAFPFSGIDVWVTRPAEWPAQPSRYWNISTFLLGFGRLKQGVGMQQARAEMDNLNHNYAMADSGKYVARMRVGWLKDQLVANVRTTLWMLFGAVGFALLIACANVAGLLLSRANSRSREFAVRAAVGAGRGGLVRQMLAESLVLAVAGGALGGLLAKWGLTALAHMSALDLPRAGEIRLDGMVLAFTVALSIATGILFGLYPSLRASHPDLADELRESGAGISRGSTRRGIFGVSMRGLLVVGQISLSILLLIGATLLMKSFARLRSIDPGFQPANMLTAKIALPPARYDTSEKKLAFFSELLSRVAAVPGVTAATLVMSLPTTPWLHTNIQIEGQPWEPDPGNWPSVQLQSITPGYFRALEIPLRRGREFSARDNSPGAPPAIIINESFARRFWPAYPRGQDPVGQNIREGADKTRGPIIGIVADVHEGSLAGEPKPEFYVPFVVHPPQMAYLAIRTEGDPLRFVNTVRSRVLAIDRDQPVSDIRTMEGVLDMTLGQRRLTMWLLGTFASVALLLAMIGMYGVIAYSVAQRTQELGIRQALGAGRSDIFRLVLGQALGLALSGVAIGVCGAFALTRVMRSLLFHVSATDPATFAGIALLFVLVALAANFIPARRATRIDPMTALRIG